MAKLTQLIDNEVFWAYATYTTIVLLKMMLMSPITAYFRITKKAFANPEDTTSLGKGESAKKFVRTDPDVERVRRAVQTCPDLVSQLGSSNSIGAAASIFFLPTMVLNGSLLYFLLQASWQQRMPHRFNMASLLKKWNLLCLWRVHLNDLENIVPFLGIGLLYALCGPQLSTALLHFRIFTGARILHTFVYLIPLPQPSRVLSWAVGYAVTISMAYQVLKTALYL